MRYDYTLHLRIPSEIMKLVDRATRGSYHCKRSDWLRAAIVQAAERELGLTPPSADPTGALGRWRQAQKKGKRR
jgi:hypothetical protein